MAALTLSLRPVLELTDEQFYKLCQANRDLRIERTAQGELIITLPTGGETGSSNARLTQQLCNWADTNELGIAFDSSTGFKLPNGAEPPDASWVCRDRWDALGTEQKRKFPPLCPDFVVELRSETNSLRIQEKMQEYMDNGAQLGWLIAPKAQQVEVYRWGQKVEVLQNPKALLGEEVLPNFALNLKLIFAGA